MSPSDTTTAQQAFETISGAEKTPDKAHARNGLRHIASLSMTKVADGLIDPKLVLAWLLTSLGAPAVYAGALVPIREAGALLPQMPLASVVRRTSLRKWIWVAGSAGQGVAAGLIVLAALSLEGAAAGFAICAALALLALCRAACSVSYKDILGKTVPKSQRGSVTGLAGSASAIGVVVFAVLLISGLVQSRGVVIAAIALAAILWVVAALLFSRMEEDPSEKTGATGAGFALLKEKPELRSFILVRGLLVSTSLAPPYLVVLGGQGAEETLGALGALVLASAVASFLSSYVWGRFADKSSKTVLMLTGILGAASMLSAVALWAVGLATQVWAMPAVLFVLMIAYHGVRQARSTYLVDLAPEDQRAAYAAVSNTVIGSLLLLAGVVGGGAALIGAQATLVVFAVMAIAAAGVALRLPEVEEGF
ncbi:Permease of the major facilitator superfamily protein [Sulfitobacter noctilucicola]|uniref:MFS family permease n=1 Tax=Sulfitobacter noctilucicola TaxID=1342301 RepID=A0A7W6Q631_9RHOB|nr:MFS transporter [Sulfitobacter noctilucicola]KIN64414.1 Permease of the major facilitator superfamily protein [Sulfitobacter noctilucicola]MBB4174427.1 MFS family permease [Sulfitobacter noctilucicola]